MAYPAGFLYHQTSLWPVQYYQGFCWGCLFQGPFWFLRRRMSVLALICLALAIATLGLSWLVVPWLATRLQVAHLRQHGYRRLEELEMDRRRSCRLPGYPLEKGSTLMRPLGALPAEASRNDAGMPQEDLPVGSVPPTVRVSGRRFASERV